MFEYRTPVSKQIMNRLDAGDDIVCVWSGMGSGKSFAMIEVALELGLTRKIFDPVTRETSPMQILIVAETEVKIKANLWLEAERVFGAVEGAIKHCKSGELYWTLPGGAQVHFKPYKVYTDGKNNLEGQKYGVILSDETFELNESWYEDSTNRCRLANISYVTGREYGGQLVWCGRPQANDNFLQNAKEQKALGARVSFIHEPTSSNKINPPDYEERIRRQSATEDEFIAKTQKIPGATYAAKGGYYSHLSGQRYEDGGNVVDFPIDPTIPTVASVDPGNNTTSIVFWQVHEIDGEFRSVIVGQHMPSDMTTDQDTIRYILAQGWNLVGVVVDPFRGTQRSAQADGKSTVDLYKRAPDYNPDGRGGGFGVQILTPPHKRQSVADGIERVRVRINSVTGDRHLLIHRSVWEDTSYDRGVKWSLQNYAPDPKTGKPDKRQTSASNKASHCCDAIRYYVCMYMWDGPPKRLLGEKPPPLKTLHQLQGARTRPDPRAPWRVR